MKIEVSDGDIVDKYTILEIKKRKVAKDRIFLRRVKTEQSVLSAAFTKIKRKIGNNIIERLKKVNRELWEAEDAIRDEVKLSNFYSEFIRLARKILVLNDERTLIKLEINTITGSALKNTKKIYRALK